MLISICLCNIYEFESRVSRVDPLRGLACGQLEIEQRIRLKAQKNTHPQSPALISSSIPHCDAHAPIEDAINGEFTTLIDDYNLDTCGSS